MMLRAESLTVRQGSFLLSGVTLGCAAGQCLALVGASGSGKTTCLEIMAGLRRADSGRVWIDGRDVTALPPERRGVSYLPQDVALFPHLSARENIRFPARMRGVPLDGQRMAEVCDMLGILSVLERGDVGSLSGGEAQRVALARALIVPPKVLFLDECFGSLDAPLRRRLARQFRDLRELTRTTTVMVTHDLGEACLMADRLAVLHRGTLQQEGPPAALFQHPATVPVAELLGMHNILPVRCGRADGGFWRCDVGGLDLLTPRTPESTAPPAWIGFYGWDAKPAGIVGGGQRARGGNVVRLRVLDCLRQAPADVWRLCAIERPQTVIEIHWPADQRDALVPSDGSVEIVIPAESIHAWSGDA
jgi:ABC-type Fe3+/spermidine/putrescine transport system ATPase subunit